MTKIRTHLSSVFCLSLAGPTGSPSMGMLGPELSSSLTPGAKVTLLKEGGGGSTGTESIESEEKLSSAATVTLFGTREEPESEPGAGGEKEAASSGREPLPRRVFLTNNNQKQNIYCLIYRMKIESCAVF